MTVKDETYAFISDVNEKKITSRSARNARTHCGKGGRVRLPSDNLSKKELQKMNGECKSFRLNDPMTKAQFQAMPDDLKEIYIKAIRNKYGAPDSYIGNALGYSQQGFGHIVKRLGLCCGKTSGRKKWDKDGFYAWWNGVEQPTATVLECPDKEEVFMEDDLPFEEPEEPIVIDAVGEPPEENNEDQVKVPSSRVIPLCGEMDFSGSTESILETICVLLGGANVRMRVSWEVIPEEGGLCNGQA